MTFSDSEETRWKIVWSFHVAQEFNAQTLSAGRPFNQSGNVRDD